MNRYHQTPFGEVLDRLVKTDRELVRSQRRHTTASRKIQELQGTIKCMRGGQAVEAKEPKAVDAMRWPDGKEPVVSQSRYDRIRQDRDEADAEARRYKAEVERLKQQCAEVPPAEQMRQWREAAVVQDGETLMDAIRRLRSERDRAKDGTRVSELEAEVVRLRGTVQVESVDRIRAERDEARAEVERLKAVGTPKEEARLRGLAANQEDRLRRITRDRNEALAEVERLRQEAAQGRMPMQGKDVSGDSRSRMLERELDLVVQERDKAQAEVERLKAELANVVAHATNGVPPDDESLASQYLRERDEARSDGAGHHKAYLEQLAEVNRLKAQRLPPMAEDVKRIQGERDSMQTQLNAAQSNAQRYMRERDAQVRRTEEAHDASMKMANLTDEAVHQMRNVLDYIDGDEINSARAKVIEVIGVLTTEDEGG